MKHKLLTLIIVLLLFAACGQKQTATPIKYDTIPLWDLKGNHVGDTVIQVIDERAPLK